MYKRRLRYSIIKFLRLKGTPGKLALGFAVGACVNFYPTFGFGVPLAALAAGLVLANVPAGILGDLIFKPLFPFFFYLNLVTGSFLWTGRGDNLHRMWRMLLHPKVSAMANLGKFFFTGAIVNSLILGIILYIMVYFVVERYRLPILKWFVSRNRRNPGCD